MTHEQIQEYTLRISQASASKLIIIQYELAILYLKEAQSYFAKEEQGLAVRSMKHAQQCVQQLINSLNYDRPETLDVLQLIFYTNKTIIQDTIIITSDHLPALIRILESLQKAMEAIDALDTDEPMMSNTQKVYAGLTYGKGYLNESALDPDHKNRGFQA